MSVNALGIEDVRLLLNDLHTQVTGQAGITPTSTADFISMAQATLAAGTDKVWSAMQIQLSKTLFATRPYTRKFGGLLADDIRWGGIIQKVSFADSDLTENEKVYHPVDGTSVDQWVQKKGDILVTRYTGSDVFQDWITVYDQALRDAFLSEAQLGAFYAAKMQELSNKWEQYLEELNRTALGNFIAAKVDMEASFPDGVVHLLTEYNTLTGASPALTDQTVYQPENIRGFFQFVRARINTISRLMTNRSVKFQAAVTGKVIARHTPLANQKMYILSEALDQIDTMVNTNTYHNEPLAYADVEAVDYWQAIDNPDELQLTPVEIDASGAAVTGSAVTISKLFGVIFDEDAVVTNTKDYRLESTPLNARGLYRNTWLTSNSQYCNDLTEKGVVLLLD